MPTAHKKLIRSINVDVIRLMAMFMVIILHTSFNFTQRTDFFATKLWFILEPLTALSKTSVLLFFMLSGYLVINKNRSIRENWQKIRTRLLIPLLFFSSLNAVYAFYNYARATTHELPFWRMQFERMTNFPSSPLWFLGVLLILYILNPLWQEILRKKNRNLAIYLTLLTFLFSALSLITKVSSLKNEMFFNSFTGWMGYVFFYLYGGLVYNKWVKYQHIGFNMLLIIIGFIPTVIGDYYTGYAAAHSLTLPGINYTSNYLSLPVMLMAIGLFNLFISADFMWLLKNFFGVIVVKSIQWLNKLSFGIYLIHTFVISVFLDILGLGFDTHKLSANVYLYNIENFALVFFISLIITYIIRKIPRLRVVIGEES